MFQDHFKNKIVLVTGHTGFKGSWLAVWLKELGAQVIGYALEPYTPRDNFVVSGLASQITHIVGDIRDDQKLRQVFGKYHPEIVFHLAAQPIVRESYANPKETFDVNVGGTVNVFESCRLTDSVKTIVNITSDKCYEPKAGASFYHEGDALGGFDPYSSSKGCAELITTAYRRSFFDPQDVQNYGKALSSARAGNCIGGGDWQSDRLIPDCIRALESNSPIEIRNPQATRPWQHVLDALSGYLTLAMKMEKDPNAFSGAWNFGPEQDAVNTVGEVVDMIVKVWGQGSWTDVGNTNDPHEASELRLDISKAKTELNWHPVWDAGQAVDKTVKWYRRSRGQDGYSLCTAQIREYMA